VYKVTLVTSLSETVVSMQQFLSSSCSPCVIFSYYSWVVLQSYFLVSYLYVCGILEEQKMWKRFSLHEKKTFSEELGSCKITGKYRISRPIIRTVVFLLGILEKNNDDCILILVIYWKKTGLLHTKISNHNLIYSS